MCDTEGWIQDVGVTRLTAVAASADTPVAPRSRSVVSLTPSSTEKRHRSVAASPTRFFELLVSKACSVLYCFRAQHRDASECCHAVYTWLQALCCKACMFNLCLPCSCCWLTLPPSKANSTSCVSTICQAYLNPESCKQGPLSATTLPDPDNLARYPIQYSTTAHHQ